MTSQGKNPQQERQGNTTQQQGNMQNQRGGQQQQQTGRNDRQQSSGGGSTKVDKDNVRDSSTSGRRNEANPSRDHDDLDR